MRRAAILLALLGLFALSCGSVHAQVLPPPRAVQMQMFAPRPFVAPNMLAGVLPPHGRPIPSLPLAASPFPPPGYQPSAYQVWQNYGLTYEGWLRPRIMQTPHGGFWLYNGAPFPYSYVMPGHHFQSIAPAGAPGP
jgi:hypothetical protein